MKDFQLRLIPENQDELVISLYQDIDNKIDITESAVVYADCSYTMQLEKVDFNNISDISVYVNGNQEACSLDRNFINFSNQSHKRTIFSDYFGFVKLEFIICFDDNSKLHLVSKNLSVLVKKGTLSETVDSMLNYIFQHDKELLYKNEQVSIGSNPTRQTDNDNVTSKLRLAEEICVAYENSFGYFNANSRFKVEETLEIDHIEKLHYATPQTLQYMATHPEVFKNTAGVSGIRLRGKNYYPEKALIQKNFYSTDTIENQVIVGFIRKVIYDMDSIKGKIDGIIEKIPTFMVSSKEYIHSASFIFNRTENDLYEKKKCIETLIERFKILHNIYIDTLQVTLIEVNKPPKPTPVFMSIPHYNMIFNGIYQWFDFGIYDFRQESFMLSTVNIASLYEIYVLCRLIEEIKNAGYVYSDSFECRYPTHARSKFINSDCKNTFIFKKEQSIVTLYYQPMIYNVNKTNINDIGLYRNNSYSLGEEGKHGSYYAPDFIIKISDGEHGRYNILDAKFSRKDTVERYHVASLCYKYLFSISTMSTMDTIDGMYILYGKGDGKDKESSIYDFELQGTTIRPKAMIMPIAENNSFDSVIPYMVK